MLRKEMGEVGLEEEWEGGGVKEVSKNLTSLETRIFWVVGS